MLPFLIMSRLNWYNGIICFNVITILLSLSLSYWLHGWKLISVYSDISTNSECDPWNRTKQENPWCPILNNAETTYIYRVSTDRGKSAPITQQKKKKSVVVFLWRVLRSVRPSKGRTGLLSIETLWFMMPTCDFLLLPMCPGLIMSTYSGCPVGWLPCLPGAAYSYLSQLLDRLQTKQNTHTCKVKWTNKN